MEKESDPRRFQDLPKPLKKAIKGAVSHGEFGRIMNVGFAFQTEYNPDGSIKIKIGNPAGIPAEELLAWTIVTGLYDPERRVKILRERHPDATDPSKDGSNRAGASHPVESRGKHRSKTKASGSNADLQKHIARNRRI